jgi:hypothetical protein
MAAKGLVDGVAGLTGQMQSDVEVANEGEVTFAGLVERESDGAGACDGDVKLEMPDLSVFAGTAQIAAEVTGQGADQRAVQVRAAATTTGWRRTPIRVVASDAPSAPAGVSDPDPDGEDAGSPAGTRRSVAPK